MERQSSFRLPSSRLGLFHQLGPCRQWLGSWLLLLEPFERFVWVGREELFEWKCVMWMEEVDELMVVEAAMGWLGDGEWARGFL